MNKKIVIIGSVIFLITASIGAGYFFIKSKKKPATVELTPAQVVVNTIQAFDPLSPVSFYDIQKIVDLGPDAIQPLAKLAASDDDITQWAVVTGLTSIRRTLNEQEQIAAVISTLYQSKFLPIRVLAASSNAEFGDLSGVPILIQALSGSEIMLYMDPPQPVSRFANRSLEYSTAQSFGFDDTQSQEQQQAAVGRWQDWWSANQPVE